MSEIQTETLPGIALKATWALQKDLSSGAIVQCLEEYWCDAIDLFAICASKQNLPPRIRVLLDFIAKHLPVMVKSEGLVQLDPRLHPDPERSRVGKEPPVFASSASKTS